MYITIVIYLSLFFLLEFCYFQIARRFNIVDKPNKRSSHDKITIRGGGIIFPISAIITWPYNKGDTILLVAALTIMSLVCFIDDIRSLPSLLRLLLQLFVMLLVGYYYNSSIPFYILPLVVIMLIGITNAYNFMDGINGITVTYSMVGMCTLYWVQHNIIELMPEDFFLSIIAALFVFSFFNFRRHAKTFAGDIGSVSIAMILSFLILDLILVTGNSVWVLLFGVYGIDTVSTIICRIFRKERLMQAHRSHFYQYLANEAGWSHISTSILYGSVQLALNLVVIYGYLNNRILLPILILFVFLVIYSIFRLRFEGTKRLFVIYNPD